MENSISVNLSPLQMLLSLAFEAWIIIFPIIIIKKLNYLTQLLQSQYEEDEADQDSSAKQ